MLNKVYLDVLTGSLWVVVEELDHDPWSEVPGTWYRLSSLDVPDRFASHAGLEDMVKIGMLEEV